jgi:hypothetical protein
MGKHARLLPLPSNTSLSIMEVKGMVRSRSALFTLAASLVIGGIAVAGSIQSGPPVGEKVPGPFAPLNLTGPDAGKKSCQYCKNGARPVAVIFAKQLTPAMIQLLKKIDAATAANKERSLGSYVVFCSDAPGFDQQLLAVAREMHIENTVVTLYKAGGPERYRLAAEADVTVLLYSHFTVKANHAFKNGELTESTANAILADLAKMLSEE